MSNQQTPPDLIGIMSKMSGIPRDEMAWMTKRTMELHMAGVPKADLLVQVREEAKSKPWLEAQAN